MLYLTTLTDTYTVRRFPLDNGSARSKRLLPDKTQHSQQTDIHAPGGIRDHNPIKRVTTDPSLRPRDHRDRHVNCYVQKRQKNPISTPISYYVVSILILSSHLRSGIKRSSYTITLSFIISNCIYGTELNQSDFLL